MRLASMTTDEVRELLDRGPVVALLPVGSVEPHGPHLPLETDTIISDAAAEGAVPLLAERSITALVVPPIPYGVTDFAEGFAGAVSLPAAALSAFARSVIDAYLGAGFSHVCLVNNHLEPAHDRAVRSAIEGFPPGAASVACPLTRRWARTLSPEFKSGACHAGRYETSIVLAAAPEATRELAASLPEVPISLSEGIREGKDRFRTMGMTRAYAGAPADATAEEGRAMIERLAVMIATEVEESMAATGER